jgi:hypothetical protein
MQTALYPFNPSPHSRDLVGAAAGPGSAHGVGVRLKPARGRLGQKLRRQKLFLVGASQLRLLAGGLAHK